MANQDIAVNKQGCGLYVYNYSGDKVSVEVGLDDISFQPALPTTQAIAVRHNKKQIVLLSTDQGTFILPKREKGYRAEVGFFDKNNKWVKQRALGVTSCKLEMNESTQCVLLTLK